MARAEFAERARALTGRNEPQLNPDQFQALAEECRAKAETAHDPEVRRWYRNMAAQWAT